ncbi:MAG: hypothetical protein ACRDH2_07930, partial [Anaerolineales bacterium]
AWLGAPVVHAAMAGRFVAQVPFPRLSFLAAALTQPKFWPLATQAHLASLRATFYGTSAIFSAQGETLARAEEEEAAAIAGVVLVNSAGREGPAPALKVPFQLRWLERLLLPLASLWHRRTHPAS